MSTHIITAANSLDIGIVDSGSYSFVAVTAGAYIVQPGGSLVTNSAVTLSGGNSTLTDQGLIYGTAFGINLGAFNSSGAGVGGGNTVTIGSTGIVDGGRYGVYALGGSNIITNDGVISSSGGALPSIGVKFLEGGNVLNNHGAISSAQIGVDGDVNTFDPGLISGGRINNTGDISGTLKGVSVTRNYNIANIGAISGGEGTNADGTGITVDGTGVKIANSGLITGGIGIQILGSSSAGIVNTGKIAGIGDAFQIQSFAGDSNRINNSGSITGGENGAGLTINNNAGDLMVINSGTITNATPGGIALNFGNGIGRFWNLKGGNVGGAINFGSKSDNFVNGGDIRANTIAMGASADNLTNTGTITATIDMGADGAADNVVNIGTIHGAISMSGTLNNRGLIYGPVTMLGSGVTVRNSGTILNNVTLGNGSNTFNGVGGTVDGSILGGTGQDIFVFSAAGFSAANIIDGGSGASNDVLRFTTPGAIAANALANVTGIEQISLAKGTNSIVLSDDLVASANGHSLTVRGSSGADTIDGSALTATTNSVTFYGVGGADHFLVGRESDVFTYANASESTSVNYDTISGASFAHDAFHIADGTAPTIDAAVTAGALSSATFDANLGAAVGPAKLGANGALLFTASAGTLSGQTFLVVDINGVAGYQAGLDLVVHLTGQTGTLATANFI